MQLFEEPVGDGDVGQAEGSGVDQGRVEPGQRPGRRSPSATASDAPGRRWRERQSLPLNIARPVHDDEDIEPVFPTD